MDETRIKDEEYAAFEAGDEDTLETLQALKGFVENGRKIAGHLKQLNISKEPIVSLMQQGSHVLVETADDCIGDALDELLGQCVYVCDILIVDQEKIDADLTEKAREKNLARAVLNGITLKRAAEKIGISTERVREVVVRVCREASSYYFFTILPPPVTIRQLRNHKEEFLCNLK